MIFVGVSEDQNTDKNAESKDHAHDISNGNENY